MLIAEQACSQGCDAKFAIYSLKFSDWSEQRERVSPGYAPEDTTYDDCLATSLFHLRPSVDGCKRRRDALRVQILYKPLLEC